MRPLFEIAREIDTDWKKVSVYALPYLNAMYSLESIDSKYGLDSGKSIVNYFLANAGSWKGETARRIKKELNQMVR